MRKILITGIGGDVACAVIRCILEDCPEDLIYGVDIKKYTPYMCSIHRADVVPPYTDAGYMEFIKNYIKKNGITHFIPTTEPEIIIADCYRKFFDENDVKLVINNHTIIDICTSKYKTACFLTDHHISAPASCLAADYAGQFGYPFVVKADSGSGSSSLGIINNEARWLETDKEGMICQQYIGNEDKEYTVGVFSDGVQTVSVIYKRKLGPGGMSVEIICCNIPEIEHIADSVARVFGLRGSINIQIREENGKFYIFEINPRLSSTTGFRHKMGFKDAVWWLKLSDGESINMSYKSPVGYVGVKVTDDIVISPLTCADVSAGGGILSQVSIKYITNTVFVKEVPHES